MSDWKKDKEWADGVNSQVKALLGQALIHESGNVDDTENNTDMMVFPSPRTGDACRIAVRVRNYKFFERYKHEFTIRSVRGSGILTELDKILDGHGDYMFYGFKDASETGIAGYTIFDLRKFAEWYREEIKRPINFTVGHADCILNRVWNHDKISGMDIFEWAWLPEGVIIAQWLG